MRTCYTTLYLVGALTVLSGSAWSDRPNSPEWRDLPEYLRRLERSDSQKARSVLRQIQNGSQALARERAAARRQNIPLNPVHIALPTPEPEQDAAPVYERLRELLSEKPLDRSAVEAAARLGSHYAYDPQDLALTRRLFAQRQDVVQLVHLAADKPHCTFRFRSPYDLAPLFDKPSVHPQLRQAARLLRAESYLLAKDGRYEEAILNQAHGFRVAEHAASEPQLTNYLTGMAILALTLDGMKDVLYLADTDPLVAQKVQSTIWSRRPRLRPRRILEGELLTGLDLIKRLRGFLAKGGPDEILTALGAEVGAGEPRDEFATKKREVDPQEKRLWGQLLDAVEAEYLLQMGRLIATADEPYSVSRPVAQQFIGRLLSPDETPILNVLRFVMSPAPAQIGRHKAQASAREAVVRAGAILLAFKAAGGTWPERLDDSQLTLPQDAFSGRPLQYRREGNGFVVYSVGPTGRFDGGQPGSDSNLGQTCFRFPAPPPLRPMQQPATPPSSSARP